MPEGCKESVSLSCAVVDAVSKVYQAKFVYDSAKQKRGANTDPLAAALQGAREFERLALRALDDHVKQHGCEA